MYDSSENSSLQQQNSNSGQSFDYGWNQTGLMNPSANIDSSVDPVVLQQTRHARRLYVGGIPQNYANEELIIKHFNAIIAEGLGEENDHSYVNSVYINHKKCFAFVELKSMELTTACLELDGIVYHNSILKIQRANEYKPELVPGPTRPPLKLKLPSSAYLGSTSNPPAEVTKDQHEPRMGSIVQQGSMVSVERGSVVLIGFPHDEGARRAGSNVGSASGPKVIRRYLRKVGTIQNPEYDLDLGSLRIIDIGDITAGMSLEEAQTRLTQTVNEIIRRGALPIVIGGSGDLSYSSASGLMSVAGGNIGVVAIDSKLGVRPPNQDGKTHAGTPFRQLLEDTRFCSPRDGLASMPTCDGKFLVFGAQGTLCSEEHTKYIQSRSGYILWLAKDLRSKNPPPTSTSPAADPSSILPVATSRSGQVFREALRILGENPSSGGRRPLFVSIRMSAMNASVSPGVDESGSMGFSGDEALEMCHLCGGDQNVVLLDICEFNPEVEESRTGRLIAEMIYYFILGFALRLKAQGNLPPSSPSLSSLSPPSLSSISTNMSIPSAGVSSSISNRDSNSNANAVYSALPSSSRDPHSASLRNTASSSSGHFSTSGYSSGNSAGMGGSGSGMSHSSESNVGRHGGFSVRGSGMGMDVGSSSRHIGGMSLAGGRLHSGGMYQGLESMSQQMGSPAFLDSPQRSLQEQPASAGGMYFSYGGGSGLTASGKEKMDRMGHGLARGGGSVGYGGHSGLHHVKGQQQQHSHHHNPPY